ncbi:molybdopterin molybdotransferase MoeA [Christensenellaceae bacterium OttesenSCG-928-M15]|nr:molybdopterin molybdotransferase MoeA [Christensenellaceae bacterium OttesenSCG-928-M15]
MLQVATSAQAAQRLKELFGERRTGEVDMQASLAPGHILRGDVYAAENVPGFTRSSVDGYAVHAKDTFGCSDSIPALLLCKGEVEMGQAAPFSLQPGECAYVPTGGQLPDGADAMVMVEHTEAYAGDTIGICKATAPGTHCVFKGDDVQAGQLVLKAGRRLHPHDVGTLSAMGISHVAVAARPIIGVLSTGDELILPENIPAAGQIRDVNGPLLCAAAEAAGGKAVFYGICPDEPEKLREMLQKMADASDIVLLSGGTSVGTKDATPRIIEELGKLHLHGIAIKPGKPTILGEIANKPVFGMPGHPVAAYFIFRILVAPLIGSMLGCEEHAVPSFHARLKQAIPSNHGREECIAVRLEKTEDGLLAMPIIGKSGLITLLSQADGYLRIPRDQEGLPKGEQVEVIPFINS